MKKTLLSSVAAAVLIVGTTLAIAQSSGSGTGTSSGGAGAGGSGALAPGGSSGSGGANVKANGADAKGSPDTLRQSQGNTPDPNALGPKKSDQKATDQKATDQKAVEQKAVDQKAAPQDAQKAQNAQGASGSPKQQTDSKGVNKGGSHETTGTVGSSTSVTTEQRTQLREKIGNVNLRRVNNVDFTISVGTVIPRTVTYYDLPPDIIRVVPAYRRYKYIMIGNQLLIIDPRRRIIIDVIDV